VSTTPMMVKTRIGALCHEPGGPWRFVSTLDRP
jgi:hypothetical protein